MTDRIRLHPQLPHNSNAIVIPLLFLIRIYLGNASRVTSWPWCEELIVPNSAVWVMIGSIVVVYGRFAFR